MTRPNVSTVWISRVDLSTCDNASEIKKLMDRLQYHTQKQANYEKSLLHLMKEAVKGNSQGDGPAGSRGY